MLLSDMLKTKRFKVVTLVVFMVLVLCIAFIAITSQKFHIVSIEPGLSNVSTVAPFIKVNFNEPLSSKNLSVSSSYSFVTSYKIQGKTLVATLSPPLTAGYTYTITIKSIVDSSGNVIKNKVLSFIPKYIAGQSLPVDQQQALLKAQAKAPRSPYDIAFSGTSALSNIGMSAEQVTALEQEFFDFNNNASIVNIDTSSVVVAPHDPSSSSVDGSVSFDATVDSTGYTATVTYSYDGDDVRLQLYNTQGGDLIFDSDAPTPDGID